MSQAEFLTQPPDYSDLYTSFSRIALWGDKTTSLFDDSFEPGKNGTLTPDGDLALEYTYEIDSPDLSESFREKGIDKLTIGRRSSVVWGEEVLDEQAWVYVHEQIGIEKSFIFSKNTLGSVAVMKLIHFEPEDTAQPIKKMGLTPQQRDHVVNSLKDGDEYWLNQDGAVGNFARLVHLIISGSHQPDDDDIALLNDIALTLS